MNATNKLVISPLRQAKCSDRNDVTRDFNTSRWLLPVLPDGWKIHSFHFFMDWANDPATVTGPFLMTRLVDIPPGDNPNDVTKDNILQAFYESGSDVHFEDLLQVSANCSREIHAVLLPESGIPVSDRTPFWTVIKNKTGAFEVLKHDVAQLKKRIRALHRTEASIGGKGLTYGTSTIECFLSLSNDIFPGDVDAVVVDELSHVQHVIEFKRHNISAPIDQHLADRYYPKQDSRKYASLQAFVSEVNVFAKSETQLTIFYYTTREPHQIRLQSVAGIDCTTIHIDHDSGTVGIDGKPDADTATKIARWLVDRTPFDT